MLDHLMRGKISVIIPLYNNEEYIINCIDSVINQRYEDFEIIVVDDGSTDNGYNLVKDKYKKNEKVILIRQDNQGPSVARNNGISYATGRWIVFLDSDDQLDENALNILVSNSKDSDLVIAGWSGIYANSIEYYGPSISKQMEKDEIRDLGDYLISNGLLYKSPDVKIPSIEGPVAKLYSTKVIREQGISFPSNLLYAEDVIFNYSYLQFCEKVNTINISIYNASRRQGSLSNRRINFIEVYDDFSKIVRINNIEKWDIEKALSYRKFVWIITYFEKEIKNIKIKDLRKHIVKYDIEDLNGLNIDKLSKFKRIEYKALTSNYLKLYFILLFGSFLKDLKNKIKYGRKR